jgi:hypothetical protein
MSWVKSRTHPRRKGPPGATKPRLLVNMNMAIGDAPIKFDPVTAQILKQPSMVNPGVYQKPIPFGGIGKPVNQNRFAATSPSP